MSTMTGTEYMGNNALDGAGLQKQLLMDIHEIFASEDDREDKDRKGEEGNDEQDGDEDEVVDLVDMANKTEKLRDVLEAVRQLWSTKSEHVDLVTEKLADGSRDRKCTSVFSASKGPIACLADISPGKHNTTVEGYVLIKA